MKYLYSIVGIIFLLSCVMWAISINGSSEKPGKNALVVNDRSIPFSELLQLWQQKPYHYRDQEEFLEDLVLRELLIQEAIASGIADEEQFKQLIQDFFEQSLMKTLLDRKQLENKITISAEDLSLFRKARQSHYQLTLVRYATYQQAQQDNNGQQQALNDDFVNLPEAVQSRLLPLRPGVLSPAFADGAEFVRLRIEKIEPLTLIQGAIEPDEELRQQLQYMLQQQQLGEWIQQIRLKAVVQYPQQRLEKGED